MTGKTAARLLNVKISVPLFFLVSVLPDIDLILGLEHRGPTHSLLVYLIFLVPAFWLYGKRVVPVFVALAQHSLLGDFLTGGRVQVLWPVVSEWYGVRLPITSLLSVSLEWAAFLASMVLLWKTKDVVSLFQHHPSNLLLTIPVFAIILPALLSFPMAVPPVLIIPHLVFLAILAISISVDLKQTSKIFRH